MHAAQHAIMAWHAFPKGAAVAMNECVRAAKEVGNAFRMVLSGSLALTGTGAPTGGRRRSSRVPVRHASVTRHHVPWWPALQAFQAALPPI